MRGPIPRFPSSRPSRIDGPPHHEYNAVHKSRTSVDIMDDNRTVANTRLGLSEGTLAHVQALHRGVIGPFTVSEAAEILAMDSAATRKLLSYLVGRGWLTSVSHGLYVAPPLDATDPTAWREDPWIVAAKLFAPCYVGGWSACEHWGLTDQVFREIVVVSARRSRRRATVIQDTPFRVKVRSEHKFFGTQTVWRGRVSVAVSDPTRTIVDVLDDPSIGGGMRHVADIITSYVEEGYRDDAQLDEYASRLGNRTVYKRLGYVIEAVGIAAPELAGLCLTRKSSGLTGLDPTAGRSGRINRRWDLRINVRLGDE